jgi:phosphopantothenate synthetase
MVVKDGHHLDIMTLDFIRGIYKVEVIVIPYPDGGRTVTLFFMVNSIILYRILKYFC